MRKPKFLLGRPLNAETDKLKKRKIRGKLKFSFKTVLKHILRLFNVIREIIRNIRVKIEIFNFFPSYFSFHFFIRQITVNGFLKWICDKI